MTKNTIDLYKVGSKVKLENDVYGNIIGIYIFGDNSVTYKCGWWNGRAYCTESFSPNEIEVMIPEKFKIGFGQ